MVAVLHVACIPAQGRRNVNVGGGGEEGFLKIEESRSLEMAISEFYQRLFERSISSLIEPCVRFLTP